MEFEPHLPNSDGHIIRFPVKLRRIIDTCGSGAIKWNHDGTIIRINKTLFETEYLTKDHRPFQTTSFSSFIRQLNFYGFQKVNQRTFAKGSENVDSNVFDYRHPHFRKNNADLSLVQRKNKSRRPRNFEDAFARIIEPSSKSLGTWLPFRSLPDDLKPLPKEVQSSPETYQVQVYVVGQDGILVPVETATVLRGGAVTQPIPDTPTDQSTPVSTTTQLTESLPSIHPIEPDAHISLETNSTIL